MPFIDKTPLNYKPNSASSIRRFQLDRAPTSSDYRNFLLGDEWLDTDSNDWWKLCDKTKTFGTWRKMAGTASAIETITGDIGGAVPPDAINNINLTGTSGITITGIPGTNTLSIDGSGVDQQQVVYVGKHGNDANDGLTIEAAKLTFTNAITTAAGISPATVMCFDDGNYTENITLQSNVNIFAPGALLTGTIIGVDDSSVKFRAQSVATGLIGVTKPAGTGYFFVEIDDISVAGVGIGVIATAGFINYTWKRMTIADGFGVGDGTSAVSHFHLKGGDIYVTSTGIAIARANSGSTVGRIDHILDTGGGNGTGIVNIGGNIDLSISRVEDFNTAIGLDAGTTNLSIRELSGTTAYSVGALATLNLVVNQLTGAETVLAGGVRRVSRLDGTSIRNPIEITQETGDPFIRFDINQVDKFSFGVDDTDGDSLKITDGADPSSGNIIWKMTAARERTMPLQPAFSAELTNSQLNVTGDGTGYSINTVGFTEFFDIGNNFDNTTGIFTAPVAGIYSLTAYFLLRNLAPAHTSGRFFIFTTNRTYEIFNCNAGLIENSSDDLIINGTILTNMSAGHTAYMIVNINGGPLVVDVGNILTQFSGILMV